MIATANQYEKYSNPNNASSFVHPKPPAVLSSQAAPTMEPKTATQTTVPRGLWNSIDTTNKAPITTTTGKQQQQDTPFPVQMAPEQGVKNFDRKVLVNAQDEPVAVIVRKLEDKAYTIFGLKPIVPGQEPVSSDEEPKLYGKHDLYEWGAVASACKFLNHAAALGSKEYTMTLTSGTAFKAQRVGRVMGEHAFANTPYYRYNVTVDRTKEDFGFEHDKPGFLASSPNETHTSAAVLQQTKTAWTVTSEPGVDPTVMVALTLILDAILEPKANKMFE